MKTENDLIIEAYQVQNACNLSGVIHSFSRALTRLRELGINDTDKLNTHPVSILYSDKIASLTGSSDTAILNEAYQAYFNLEKGSQS